MKPHIETFCSPQTPWKIFQRVYADSKICFFLDSPRYAPPDQVYSYIGMNPSLEIRLDQGGLHVEGEINRKYSAKKVFAVLKKIFRQYRCDLSNPFPFFSGGFVGYFGYELAPYCDKVRLRPKKGTDMPKLYLGLFKDVIVYDHHKRNYHIVIHEAQGARRRVKLEQLKAYFDGPEIKTEQPFKLKRFSADMTKARFEAMVKKAKEYIAAGDIYQANLSQRFSFGYSGSALELYGKLRAINPSPFSCFLKMHDLEIVSSSPERLIRKRGSVCETRPIAGTYPAYGPKRRLQTWRQKLLQNEKENAEHLMLVDLERNDLGRVCNYRSVRVEDFMTFEKYSHVVHLVSKITGRLKKGKDAWDLIKAMFPGGTITGCPKIRCMQIINELEPVRRGIYTGSIGYIDLFGDMDLNIVIRTLILRKNKGYLQVGAGIVYDSDPEKEYEETLHKAEALMKAIAEANADGCRRKARRLGAVHD